MNNDITIVILSCSNFSDLWSNHIFLLNKHWLNHPNFIIASDGEGLYDTKSLPNLFVYQEEMSNRIINVLNEIQTPYVFLTFDDYLLNKNVDTNKMQQILNIMKENSISYCRFFKNEPIKGRYWNKSLKLKDIPLKKTYEVNFYPSIWKKEDFLKILKKDEDIWKTEVRLTRRCRENNISGVACFDSKIYSFIDTVRKGKYLIPAYKFLKKNNLFISDRKIRGVKETVYLDIRSFLSLHLPNCMKKSLQKIMRKKGQVIYSDYADNDD